MLLFVTEKRPCSPLRPHLAVQVLLSSSSSFSSSWDLRLEGDTKKKLICVGGVVRRGGGSGGRVGRVGSGRGSLQVHNGSEWSAPGGGLSCGFSARVSSLFGYSSLILFYLVICVYSAYSSLY